MRQRIELAGLSGQTYGYSRLAETATIPSQAANVVVAELRRGRWRIHHVSHTDYLPRKDWGPVLDQVREEVPRVELLYRLNIAYAVREAEADDIRRLHDPSGQSAKAA